MNAQEFKLRRKVLSIAVAAALTSLVSISHADTATSTTGILVDSGTSGVPATLITGGNQEVVITSDIVKAGATATGAALWMEGVGNTVNNEANISRTSNTGNTYGVYLGDYSTARNDTNNKAVAGVDATAGAYGSTTMRITIPATAGTNGLNASGLVGKQLVMAGVVIDGEAQAGDTRKIVSATLVSGYTYDIVVNKAWARKDANGNPITQVGNSYNLIAGSGLNTFNNSGTVEAIYTGSAAANIRGFETNVAGDYVINNSVIGVIKGEHTSFGTAQGIDAGGDVTTMEVNNAGLITAIRTTPTLALSSNKFNELKVSAGNVGSAAAIYSQEELEAITVNNTGRIIGVGDFNPSIYLRAGEQSITNSGTISGSVNGANFGMGIGSVSDGGEIRTLSLTNTETGVINGAILGVNANAYRWYALSNFDAAGAADPTFSNLDNRLQTNNSNWGQLDATIENEGLINGKVYLSNGTHTITNTGTMTGGIDLDQRDTQNVRLDTKSAGYAPGQLGENTIQTAIVEVQNVAGSTTQTYNVYNKNFVAGEYDTNVTGLTVASSDTKTVSAPLTSSNSYGGLFTVVGTKSFTFENAGDFTGDITIHTASSNALGHVVASNITFSPYIYGSGATSADAATTFANIHGIDGNVIVVTTAGGQVDGSISVAPKATIGTVIKDGEFYRVANGVKTDLAALNAATGLPSMAGNGLLSWTPSYNNTGALIIESEVNANNVAGISTQGASALNALMSANSVLGSQVQNLSDEAAVLKASEQIRPEINGATIQSSLGVTERVFGLVDSRLGDTHLAAITGKTGIATGEQANGVGIWFEGIGMKGNQDRRENVDGYNTNAYGFALGVDKALDNDIRAGAALSYTNSAIKADGVNVGNNTDIDTYQATVYGSKLMGSWYLNGTLGFGLHQYEGKRLVLNNAVSGSHDGWQYSAKVDAGYPLQVGTATLTPVGSLAYSHLSQDGYTESGLGALNVANSDVDSFKSGLGAKAIIPLSNAHGFKTALLGRAIWSHEFGDVQQDTTASFVGGTTSFTTNGVSVARDGLNLGASLSLSSTNKGLVQNLSISYDADVRDQYLSHTARLQARFDF